MASTRDAAKIGQIALEALPAKREKKFGRLGPPTKGEKAFIAEFVQDMPAAPTERQIGALATTMRRSKDVIRRMIEEATEAFQDNAKFYIETHRKATEAALKHANAEGVLTLSGQEVAIKASQWAIENLSGGGARVVEKQATQAGPTGTKIIIGVKVGGQNDVAVGVTNE